MNSFSSLIQTNRIISLLRKTKRILITNKIFEPIINPKLIVFQGDVDLLGNSRAYFNYLYINHRNEFEFLWILQDKTVSHQLPNDVRIIYTSDKNYKQEAKKAKYIILSSVLLFNKTSKQVRINLWHGMGFKTMGYTENPPAIGFAEFKDDHFFVTSDFAKLIAATRYHPTFQKIHITGQPRNDLILSSKKTKQDFSKIVKTNIEGYDSIVLYAPTFKSIRKWDGKPEINREMNNYFYFDDFNETQLNDYLIKENILFVVKPHWVDADEYKKKFCRCSNVAFLYDHNLVAGASQLYEYFHLFDALITDFSSIYIDYLMLNRPVIYIRSTTKEYLRSRGYILEDNYDFFMPGEKVTSQHELLSAIHKALNNDSYRKKRAEIIPIYHKYIDSDASQRIYDTMITL